MQTSNGVNLLPPQQKEELFQEQRYRLFFISGILILAFLIALSLALSSVEISISGEAQSQKIFIPSQLQGFEKEISGANQDLRNLDSFYGEQPHFTELIEKISGILPQNIYLSSLSLNSTTESRSFLASLQGFSPTREILFQLKKNLELESSIKDISFPTANWVKPENIEFSVSFKMDL